VRRLVGTVPGSHCALLYSYVNPDGSPQVHEARAEIQEDGGWELADDQVPAQLARCGGYLSIQFTGYFEQRIRGEHWPMSSTPARPAGPDRGGPRAGQTDRPEGLEEIAAMQGSVPT
jgi:hypothetical protein